MSRQPKYALGRFAGAALVLFGLIVILFLFTASPPPYAYVQFAVFAVAAALGLFARPRTFPWTAIAGLCLTGIASATFLILLVLEGGMGWAHPESWKQYVAPAIVFGVLFLAFAFGFRLWNAPAENVMAAQKEQGA